MAKSSRIEPAERVYRSKKNIFIDNLIGGIAWGLGSIIGATIVVAVLGFILARVQTFPFVGSIIQNISDEIGSYGE